MLSLATGYGVKPDTIDFLIKKKIVCQQNDLGKTPLENLIDTSDMKSLKIMAEFLINKITTSYHDAKLLIKTSIAEK